MPALQVRDLPDDLYDELKAQALRENRSLTQQAIVVLRKGLAAQDVAESTSVPAFAVIPPQPSFIPFERDGVLYMTDPNESKEERHARLDKVFAGLRGESNIEIPAPEEVGAAAWQGWEERTERILDAVEEGPW